MSRQYLLSAFSVTISALLVSYLLWRIDFKQAADLLHASNRRWILVALVTTCLIPFASVVRWRSVLMAQSNQPPPFIVGLRAVMLANVLNSFLPSKMGDFAKAAYLHRSAGWTKGVGSVVVERLIDITVLGIFAIVGYLLSQNIWGLVSGVGLLICVFFIAAVILRLSDLQFLPASIYTILQSVQQIFSSWLMQPRLMAMTIFASLTVWCIGAGTLLALVLALNAQVSIGVVLTVFPLSVIAGLVPVTISGIGTRDAMMVSLFAAHISVEEATLVALGYTLMAYWVLSLISTPFVFKEVLIFSRRYSPNADETDVPN